MVADERWSEEPRVTGWRVMRWGLVGFRVLGLGFRVCLCASASPSLPPSWSCDAKRSPQKGGRGCGRGGGGGGGSRSRSRGGCRCGGGRSRCCGCYSGGGDRSRRCDGGGGGGGGGNGQGDRASTEADAPHLDDLEHDVHVDGTDARADHPDLAGPAAALPPHGAGQPRA
eukprot:353183-Chlamydomonas_euryale.AAC.2